MKAEETHLNTEPLEGGACVPLNLCRIREHMYLSSPRRNKIVRLILLDKLDTLRISYRLEAPSMPGSLMLTDDEHTFKIKHLQNMDKGFNGFLVTAR